VSETELGRLEDELPALAAEASRQAYQAALEVGSVIVVEDGALVEVFRDGRRVVLREMPPRREAPVGTTIRARS